MTKQLKKLSFAKEELVNLNEYEMSHIKGGEQATWTTITTSSDPCIASITASIGITYDVTKQNSWWVCGKQEEKVEDKIEPIELSEIYDKEDNACTGILPPIIVRG